MPSVHRRTFDGLFAHAVPLDDPLRADLKRVGYDPDKPQERYAASVWREAILVARRHVYAELEDAEALRALGRRWVNGFARTLVGSVFAAAAPLLGPERVIVRLPGYMHTAREDVKLEVSAEREACWRAVFSDPHPLPEFVAGVMEAILLLTRCVPAVAVTSESASGYELRVAWTRSASRNV